MGVATTKTKDSQRQRIEAELSKIGYALPGTLSVRAYRCGKSNCRCHTDDSALHGPYAYWTRKVGKVTKSRVLTPEQLADYQQWFDNARRLKQLIAELYELGVSILDDDPRSLRADRRTSRPSDQAHHPPPTQPASRRRRA